MPLTTAEKNRRKRERKKKEREEAKNKEALASVPTENKDEGGIEIEYVSEPLLAFAAVPSAGEGDEAKDDDMASVLRRFQERAAVLVSDDETAPAGSSSTKNVQSEVADKDDGILTGPEDEEDVLLSKRKLRELVRPSISDLKNRVARADLVEAHDVTAPDPDLLLHLKAVPGTVPVPRHWGRKRKYLQGKRGIEKAPFALPDFIVKTGITSIRSAVAEDESKMSAKQKNRARVGPKMGAMDVDYRTLYDAFFKYQTKNSHKLTSFGDLYYEGKEFETNSKSYPVGILSDRLREALGMTTTAQNICPPPWLIHMQRYGPPPSYPNLKIPGLNAPIPQGASYGYHVNGWGKPPVDAFGRPLYGGNPFDTTVNSTETTTDNDVMFGTMAMTGTVGDNIAIVTSDGKTVGRKAWGALPTAQFDHEEEEEDDDDMEEEESSSEEESSDEEGEEEQEEQITKEEELRKNKDEKSAVAEAAAPPTLELRKGGEETPMPQPPQPLFTVLQQTAADKEKQAGAVFTSDTTYVLPTTTTTAGEKRKHDQNEHDDTEEDSDLAKKFKF